MPRRITTFFELLLLVAVSLSLILGVSWGGNAALATQPKAVETAAVAQASLSQASATDVTPVEETPIAPAEVGQSAPATMTVAAQTFVPLTATLGPLPTSAAFNQNIPVGPGDAPLLAQAPGTMNILLLGSDNAVDERYSRTDTILVASVNPDMPSVSLLSLPRDLMVRIPNHADDRINTAFELGYLRNYPGGGPAFLAVVLRKNFGIKIDHYARIDFTGFQKAVDTLGGVDVLAECELHDTFPDKSAPNGKVDLDVVPGKVSLNGKQALMFARSRWSTSDFDRARRQQKVLRSLLNKVKSSSMLQNVLGLYQDFSQNVDTDMGLNMIPTFVDIAGRLDNLAMKNRVVTFPVVKSLTRKDGAMVLISTTATIPYIAESLSPPAGNRASYRTRVELVNASGRSDMESVAAERLAWEGFLVVSNVVSDTRQPKTQIYDYTTTPKGSPIARLASIFNVGKNDIKAESDPSSVTAARIVLGKDYNSCPRTAAIAGDVVLSPDTQLIPTSTPQP